MIHEKNLTGYILLYDLSKLWVRNINFYTAFFISKISCAVIGSHEPILYRIFDIKNKLRNHWFI